MTKGDSRVIREHLFASPSHLHTAQAVFQAWPAIREEVCEQFLQHLTGVIVGRARQAFAEIAPDLRVKCKYGGRKRHSNMLVMYRPAWPKWQRPSYSRGRTSVRIQAQQPGPYGWYWGVVNPIDLKRMTAEERDRRERLDTELPKRLSLGNRNDWWVQFGSPQEAYDNWDSLVSELFKESESGGGPITDYYADNIIGIASGSIPVINAVELGPPRSHPGTDHG